MIRLSVRIVSVAALAAFSLPVLEASAQQQAPPAPEQTPSVVTVPTGPAPVAAPVFPKPDPANFTAATPTKEAVSTFLQVNLGFDENRVWEVWSIQKTPAEGVSKVVVLYGDKTGKQQPGRFEFFTLPDGKHIIVVGADNVVPFGDHPFAEYRAELQQHADGPYRGTASKDLEIVEFADFQCPHCKDAQANMEKLVVDFPKARIVFQTFPLERIHSASRAAASYGVCVTKEGGSNAFFQFASAVFDGQDGLATADGATMTLNSAVTKAGLEPAKITACAATLETKAMVDASIKLALDVNVTSVPTLMVNGRQVPANTPYETIKQIIEYQAKLDGIAQ